MREPAQPWKDGLHPWRKIFRALNVAKVRKQNLLGAGREFGSVYEQGNTHGRVEVPLGEQFGNQAI